MQGGKDAGEVRHGQGFPPPPMEPTGKPNGTGVAFMSVSHRLARGRRLTAPQAKLQNPWEDVRLSVYSKPSATRLSDLLGDRAADRHDNLFALGLDSFNRILRDRNAMVPAITDQCVF